MNILITGVAGLLGSRLAEWILDNHPEVTVIGIDDFSGGLEENLTNMMNNPNFIFYQYNAGHNLDNIFERHKITHIFHAAAWAAECASPFMRKFNYTTNLVVSANIINYAIKYKIQRFVFTSSLARYGDQQGPFVETMSPAPMDPYAVAKYAVEMDLQIANKQHGLDYCILVPHNVIGRGQNLFDPLRNFISILFYKALVGDKLTVFGDGSQTRQFSDIRDMLEPIWNALTRPQASKQIINLGGTKSHTILEVAQKISYTTGAQIIHLPERYEVKHTSASPQKSIDLLGFEHRTGLDDTLYEMGKWVKTIPLRPRTILNYEIDNGLYPQWKAEALKDGFWK